MPTKNLAVLGSPVNFGTAQNPVSIPNGTFQIPPTSLPASTTSLALSLARCTDATPTLWPNTGTTIDVLLQFSADGGATWPIGGTLSDAGGIGVFKGQQISASFSSWSFSDQNGPVVLTNVRGSIQVAGGPLVTFGFVQASG